MTYPYQEGHRGYVVNLSETCDRENPVQLITQVAVAPNVGDDSVLLAEALITDGGYGSSANDGLLAAHRGALVQTAFRGRVMDGERFSLEAFCLSCADGSGVPKAVVCPAGVSGSVGSLSSGKGWWVAFGTGCAGCALRGRCPDSCVSCRIVSVHLLLSVVSVGIRMMKSGFFRWILLYYHSGLLTKHYAKVIR